LKERYQAGSSPLREALSRLTADGLVTAEGQKGFRVAGVSLREFFDVARMRLRLEVQAFADAIRWGGHEWEVDIIAGHHRLRQVLAAVETSEQAYADHWEVTHRAFHFALIRGCGSSWTLHFLEKLYDQMERYRRVFVRYHAIPSNLLAEHSRLMEAAIARDAETALSLMREHVLMAAELTDRDMRAGGVADLEQVPVSIRSFLADDLPPPSAADVSAARSRRPPAARRSGLVRTP
ncbi:MAG TPA: FCD domain-containing protein, partial [Kaistia sp.]|jgi:DNA-binding GntR family transcriptional regulator|nr:FCD domain-containing protein [Kaistia sp.]